MMDFDKERVAEICSKSILFKDMDKNVIKEFLSYLVYKVVFIKKYKK